MKASTIFSRTAAVLLSALVSSARILHRQASVLPPSQDPFYQPDPGFESSIPGTILKSRELAIPVNGSSTSWQLLYRSTDSSGNPNAIVTTILAPSEADPERLLVALDSVDTVFVDCSLSVNLQQTGLTDPVATQALAAGWHVALPDYTSFNASYGNGVQGGQATLDVIRAALASTDITGISADATYGISGYSGGSIAGEFAVELVSDYAPELCIAGAALGGLPVNATDTVLNVNDTPGAGLIPQGTLGITAQNASARAAIESRLIPENATKFNTPLSQCGTEYIPTFVNEDIFADYITEGAAILTDPVLTPLIEAFAIMGLRNVPKVPLFVYKGVLDQVSNITVTDGLVNKYCAGGSSIEYTRNTGIDHMGELPLKAPDAFAWLQDRLNGVLVSEGCSITTQ